MFDQGYFTGGLKTQLEKIGGNPVVEITLATGERYFVRSVEETTTGYIVLDVHPRPGSTVLESGTQVLSVPYETIACVLVSSTAADKSPKIGFSSS